MLDKVLKAWECCKSFNRRCFECPYEDNCFHDNFDRVAIADMVALLKEQQQKETSWIHRKDMDFQDKLGCNHIHGMCENCGVILDFMDGHAAQYKYCPQCGGKAVQWKELA